MQAELEAQKQRRSEQEEFLRVLSGYNELGGLSARILNELISEIRVGAKYTENGVKKQCVKIVYKQACYVDLFDEPFELSDTERAEWQAVEREL
jgi:hypothetical protein